MNLICSMYVMRINFSFYLSFSPLLLFPSSSPILLLPSPSLSLTAEDYIGLYVTIAVFENTGCRCINIEVVDDNVFENDEQFTVSIFTYYDASVDISPRSSSATVTITDNDGNPLCTCIHTVTHLKNAV